jgi:hypothetical protein
MLHVVLVRIKGESVRVLNAQDDFVVLTGAGKACASYSESTLTGRHRLLLLCTMFCKFLKRLEAD